MIAEILTSIGLTPEQAELYTSLLDHGAQTAGKLSKTTKIQRTYVYPVARELVKKGLITMERKGRTTTFIPQPPERLLSQAEDVKIHAAQAYAALEGLLPSLKTKYSAAESKPVVSYFEGIEGIKKVYMDTIKEGKTIYALVEPSKIDRTIHEWLMSQYVKLRKDHHIEAKVIVATGPQTQVFIRRDEAELRDTRVVSGKSYPFQHEINIYGTKVAIINHKKGTPCIGIIIDNPVIAATFRAWFDLTWDRIK